MVREFLADALFFVAVLASMGLTLYLTNAHACSTRPSRVPHASTGMEPPNLLDSKTAGFSYDGRDRTGATNTRSTLSKRRGWRPRTHG